MLDPKPFYYARHGETDYNRQNRVQGKLDIPLNQTGISQAIEARKTLIHAGIQTICYSPLQRAKQTAELFQEVLHCPLIAIDELQEFDLGPHAGQSKGEWFYKWKQGEPLSGAEPYSAFLERALAGINKALAHPGLVLIVAHGGTYRAVEKAIDQHRPSDQPIPNCTPFLHSPLQNGSWLITP